jgi:hypothetical protein
MTLGLKTFIKISLGTYHTIIYICAWEHIELELSIQRTKKSDRYNEGHVDANDIPADDTMPHTGQERLVTGEQGGSPKTKTNVLTHFIIPLLPDRSQTAHAPLHQSTWLQVALRNIPWYLNVIRTVWETN